MAQGLARPEEREGTPQSADGKSQITMTYGKHDPAWVISERLKQDRIHVALLDEIERGLVDVMSGRTRDARTAFAELKRAATRSTLPVRKD